MSRNVLTKLDVHAMIWVSQNVAYKFKEVNCSMKIAERLVKARGDRKREEVAEAIGVSLSAISMYENGDRIPRDETKVKLAKYYNTTVQELFFN